jgi:hypothetical protein
VAAFQEKVLMTLQSQKNRERLFAQESAKRLGRSWKIEDRECPDFVITEDGRQFGLEVTESFTGPDCRHGSVDRQKEGDTQRIIDAIKKQYENKESIPLSVKLVGVLCAENLAMVVPALLAKNIGDERVGKQIYIDIDEEPYDRLQVYATKSISAEWYNIGDRVGWVDKNPMPRIAEIVERKSRKLSQYMANIGSDIRLLIVTNRIQNSGKSKLEGQPQLDKKGFHAVYFFSYPEDVFVFD